MAKRNAQQGYLIMIMSSTSIDEYC
uniref:Uncharacterized protein n=1 Tax=Anguilla anguilla TaxID=7936 RepID=A0A0E9Q2Y0_ANGAN